MEKLPQDVLENIMRRLTPYDIIRLGQSWNSLGAVLASRPLSIPCSRFASFLSVTLDLSFRCSVHDVVCNVWVDVPLKFKTQFLPRKDGVLACDGGLLCLGTTMMKYGSAAVEGDVHYESESNSEFFICNPLTRSWAAIPAIPERQVIPGMSDAVGLCCKKASDGYEIFVLTHYKVLSPSYAEMRIYSSSKRTWRGFPYVFVDDGWNLASSSIVCCDSVLYSLWRKRRDLTIFEHDSEGTKEINYHTKTQRSLLVS
ncbi:hypothetical protein KP509_12G068200 [Ceratopteris richardii]|uniref:F-box domain-containing protein n=1 Tax=Ceratopteris richardii TaxID=49495 RepID=A0A8T2TJW5_CERRI|nr:hypothetical protein KP509_12G068200 [Ceratopteris richardii]